MPIIEFQKPSDQPTGASRLLAKLRGCLLDPSYSEFKLVVAFAKVGPLLRLSAEFAAWKAARKPIRAVFGVDLKGTSKQALDFALSEFSETHVCYGGNHQFNPTFHPKVYIFEGPNRAIAFIGSNNLTVGGTETNFESYVSIEMILPADAPTLASVNALWRDAVQTSVRLTPLALGQMVSAGLVPDESGMVTRAAMGRRANGSAAPALPTFPAIHVVPPTAIPKQGIVAQLARQPRRISSATVGAMAQHSVALPSVVSGIAANTLIIQIIPHRNGEVFLSKLAVDQDPAFFGWPFTGLTVPKKVTNTAYPQQVPDPIVNIRVHDTAGNLRLSHNGYNLNTVYYESKSEIRISVPPTVVAATPAYSVMVMSKAVPPFDYEIDIYPPGSPQYTQYTAACNQTMPSGGRSTPRKFGWL